MIIKTYTNIGSSVSFFVLTFTGKKTLLNSSTKNGLQLIFKNIQESLKIPFLLESVHFKISYSKGKN